MRARFHWDAYDQINYQLSFLCNSPYKEVIQLVGCNNRSGCTEQFILDNCKARFTSPAILTDAIKDLQEQGYLRLESKRRDFFGPSKEYYKVNWTVIKAINNAIKRMP